MSKKREDRRVKITKMLLKDSLISLLHEKDISKTTIKEICERADINRATFYAHFRDQYDLIDSIKEEFMENVLSQASIEKLDFRDSTQVVTEILVFTKENIKLSTLLLSEKGDILFLKRIMEVAYNDMHAKLMKTNHLNRAKARFVSSFVITGCVGIVQNWIENGLKESPEEVAEIIGELVVLVVDSMERNDNEAVTKPNRRT